MKETLADLLLAYGYPLIFLAPCLFVYAQYRLFRRLDAKA